MSYAVRVVTYHPLHRDSHQYSVATYIYVRHNVVKDCHNC
jgi:hypothetical protein